jgi:hypothetical protein
MPCIYLVIGGVAKNFLPLLLKELEIKKKMEAIRDLSCKLYSHYKQNMNCFAKSYQ